MPGLNEVDPSTIPEVAALRAFDAQHKGELDRLRDLEEERDILMQAAEKAVRAKKVSCGPFTLVSEAIRIDWKALYDALGSRAFKRKLGGRVEREPKYTGDRDKLMVAIESGAVSAELGKRVQTSVPRYKVSQW